VSNLVQRLLSAVFLLPPVIAAFVAGGWWLKGLIIACALVCFWEYGSIVAKDEPRSRWALMLVGGAATALSLIVHDAITAILILQLSMIAFASMFVLAPGDLPTAWKRLCTLTFGVLYVGLGFLAVARLRELGDGLQGAARGGFILVAFTATWANDTCAYFAGRAFGKHKMNEVISPKKTWEGFAGGALASVVAGVILSLFLLGNTWWFGLVFGVAIFLTATLGDLAESLIKRDLGIKDMSSWLPGHGGFLDRLDSILPSAAVAYVAFRVFG
jgi:CDP-diglyceride synthetase